MSNCIMLGVDIIVLPQEVFCVDEALAYIHKHKDHNDSDCECHGIPYWYLNEARETCGGDFMFVLSEQRSTHTLKSWNLLLEFLGRFAKKPFYLLLPTRWEGDGYKFTSTDLYRIGGEEEKSECFKEKK